MKFAIILLMFLSFSAFAQNSIPENSEITVQQANRQLDSISVKLSTRQVKVENLKKVTRQLEKLHRWAKSCVEKANQKINDIDEFFKDGNLKQASPEYLHFQRKKETYLGESSECQLLLLRSREMLEAYKKTVEQLSATILLTRHTPIWKAFKAETSGTIPLVDWKKSFQVAGIYPMGGIEILVFSFLAVLSFSLGLAVVFFCGRWLKR